MLHRMPAELYSDYAFISDVLRLCSRLCMLSKPVVDYTQMVPSHIVGDNLKGFVIASNPNLAVSLEPFRVTS